MKILHVLPNLVARTGGPPFSVVAASRALALDGHSVSIFTTNLATAPQAHNRRPGATIEDFPTGSGELDVRVFPVRRPYRLAYSPELASALAVAAPSYDVVHIHSLFLHPQYAAYRAAVRGGVPYIVSPRGALDPFLRRRGRARKALVGALWQNKMLRSATLIHATSEDERQQVRDAGISTPISISPNLVNMEHFERADPAWFRGAMLPELAAKRVVIYHGRISAKKGLDTLVDAFATVHRAAPDTALVLIGPDDESLGSQLSLQIQAHGLNESVFFLGLLRNAELASALAASEVWAMPSHGENFGVAVVEALAAGVPVVTSPLVNISAEIANADAGLIVERTPAAFADAILRVLTDGGLSRRLRQNSRRFAARYNWSQAGSEVAQIYYQALGVTSP